MRLLILSLCLAYWFERELTLFSIKVNRQVYQDYLQLQPQALKFEVFLTSSTLQPAAHRRIGLFYLLFPIITLIFYQYPLIIIAIALLLSYLALLDYYYYLTDSRYLSLIFLLGLVYLLSESDIAIRVHLWNFLLVSIFFSLFMPIASLLFRREALGLGDALLFLALAPLFTFEQMLGLILLACLLGLCFALLYFCRFHRKIDRLPFIPFISLSTLCLFLVKLPPTY